MKIFVILIVIGVNLNWIFGNYLKYKTKEFLSRSRQPLLPKHSQGSDIMLIKSQTLPILSSSLRKNNGKMKSKQYEYNDEYDQMHSKKSGPIYSLLKGMFQDTSNKPEHNESFDVYHPVEEQNSVVDHHPHQGWHKPKYKKKEKDKEIHEVKGKDKKSIFSFLDLILSALSLISFGAFLLNILASLLSVFGFGFLTTTATYPTVTGTGITTTSTGIAGGGIMNRISSYFRADGIKKGLKKNKKGGKIQAEASIGGTKGDWGWEKDNTSSKDDNYSAPSSNYDSYEETSSPSRKLQRKSRSLWEPSIHPYTCFDVAARNILDSISSVEAKYECMEKVICDSNRQAKVIGNGLEYFMPIYTFSASYFGHKLGLHQNLKKHLSAIILGVLDCNCNANFPQCSHAKPS